VDNFWYYLTPDEGDAFYLFWAKQIVISIGILALFYLLSRVLRIVLARAAARFDALTDLDHRMLQRIMEPSALLVNCAGLYLVVKRLPLPERLPAIAAGVLFVVNAAIIANIVYQVMDEMLTRYGNRVVDAEMGRQLLPMVKKLCTVFLIGTALIITLKHFNYDILSLVTALGVGSLAIGLAAKDTLANMVSGFTLMIDRPFRIGDRIQLGGQVGDVIDIGLRSTKIKAPDNTFMIIPNSELCNSTLVNMAFPDLRVKGKVTLGIAHGGDVEKAKALLVSTAASIPSVLKDPAPEAYFTSFGEGSLNLALFFWVGNYNELFATTDRINCAVSRAFHDHGINIPYPTRTVLLEKDPHHASQD